MSLVENLGGRLGVRENFKGGYFKPPTLKLMCVPPPPFLTYLRILTYVQFKID